MSGKQRKKDAVWTSIEGPQVVAPAKPPMNTVKMPDINKSTETITPAQAKASQSAFVFQNQPQMSDGSGRNTQSYEGWRDQVYTDTTGNATIGFGHKLTANDIKSGKFANGISREQGEALYQQDQAKHNAQLYKREPWIANLSQSQQSAMQDMSFNMGSAFLDKFPTAKKAMMTGDFSTAALSFADSKYARQVGNRAQDNARRLMY